MTARTICTACNDTHRVPAPGGRAGPTGDNSWACTACPVPCEECRQHLGAFCAETPCACTCHRRQRFGPYSKPEELAPPYDARIEAMKDAAVAAADEARARIRAEHHTRWGAFLKCDCCGRNERLQSKFLRFLANGMGIAVSCDSGFCPGWMHSTGYAPPPERR